MTNNIALPIGTELVGDYRLDRVLGAGGFGITYLADELALGRKVTIKEYFPSDFAARHDSAEAAPRSQGSAREYRWGLDRFIEEAQTLAKFDHPHIVRVYRYFRANNTAYMVLHFEEGQSFKNWLRGLGRAPRQKELDQILEPLLEALELIHASDFLHRDIAPDNIIIRNDGSPVMIDFGSARGEIASKSRTVSALVKPGYSPYEQYAETSSQQGPWTDIYALAATLYHAVSGKRPPDAPSRVVKDEISPASDAALSAYRPRFLRAIESGLALKVESRPRSIAAWRGELLGPDAAPAPKKQEKKDSWIRGFGNKARANRKDGSAQSDAVAAGPGGKTVPLPPQPDTPGPQGGLLDFVDGLQGKKTPVKAPTPLAEALEKAGLGDDDLIRLPTDIEEQAAAKAATQAAAAGTVKVEDAPASSVFRFWRTRQRKARERAVGQKEKNKSDKSPQKQKAKPKAAAKPKKAKAMAKAQPPARIEPRRTPRPRPKRSNAGWTSLMFNIFIGAGIAGLFIAMQDKLGVFDASKLFDSKSAQTGNKTAPPPSAKRGTRVAVAPRETQSIRRAEPAVPPPENPLVRAIQSHKGTVTAVAFAENGRALVTAGKDRLLKVFDASNGILRKSIPLGIAPPTAIAVQGNQAATAHADGNIAIWDLNTGTRTTALRRNEASIWALAFTTVPGQLVAASHDWKVALWDIRAPSAPLHVFEGHKSAVQALAFSAKGPFIASGGADRSVKLWNLDTLDLVRTYKRHSDFVTALAFSNDGRWLAAAALNGEIRIWSTTSRRLRRRLRGHKGEVAHLAFSPDDAMLATAGDDGTVRLWDMRRRRNIKTFASHTGTVTALAFNPQGNHLASVGDDGKARVWSMGVVR